MSNKKYSNSIKIFHCEEFGTIRTMTDKNGEPWFVGKDVAEALGYANHRSALRNHVDEEDKQVVQLVDTQEGSISAPSHELGSKILIINESGLYSLILSSKLDSAKKFKRWVTSSVLPAIRKTGGYIPTHDAQTGARLSDTQIVRQAEQIMLKTIAHSNQIADGCVTSKEIAKSLGLSVKDFNRVLTREGVVFWNGSRYKLTQNYADRGLAQDRYFHYYALDGEKRERSYLVWTPLGTDFVRNLVENLNS